MMEQGAYGDRLGTYFGIRRPPTLMASRLRNAHVIVTRLRTDRAIDQMTRAPAPEDAFSVMLQLRDLPRHRLYLNDRLVHSGGYRVGSVSIVDLQDVPTAYLGSALDAVQFYLPRAGLDAIAQDAGARRIQTLAWERAALDPVLNHLAGALVPALERPAQVNGLFVDHVLMAVQTHVAQHYGGMRLPKPRLRGCLAPWQERRAKELIAERIDGDLSIAELAEQCQLSRSYFGRAFKQTVGLSPHRWLLKCRVDRAMELLRATASPIADVAIACGFADQSHFTRVFSAFTSASPATWRREQQN